MNSKGVRPVDKAQEKYKRKLPSSIFVFAGGVGVFTWQFFYACIVLFLIVARVSVNENFSTLLDFVFSGLLAWVGPKFHFDRKRKPESAF